MRALLRKELTEVLVPFGVAFAVIVFVWLATAQFWEVLLPPASETLQIVALSSALAGAVLGYLQFSGERWRGKLGYLCHRGTGIDGAFLAKSIAGLLGVALVGLGPPLIYALSQSLSSPNASILQWPLLLVYTSAATCGASVYGLGALAASLRRRPLVGILLIPLAGGGLWLISEMFGTPWGLETVPWRFPAIQLALAAVLLFLARGLARSGADADLALTRAAHVAIVVLALPLVLFPCDVLASIFQGSLLSEVRSEYPMIVRDRESGEFFPVVWRDEGGLFRLNPDDTTGESFGFSDPSDPEHGFDTVFQGRSPSGATEVGPPSAERRRLVERVRTRRGLTAINMGLTYYSQNRLVVNSAYPQTLRVFLDRERGILRAFGFVWGTSRELAADGRRRTPFAIEFGKPEGRTFSLETIVLEGQGEALQRLYQNVPDPEKVSQVSVYASLLDPEDGSFWRLDVLDPNEPLQRVDLPGGDQFVRFEPLYRRNELVYGRYQDSWADSLVVGERGRYEWNGREFVEFISSPQFATADEAQDLLRFRVVVDDPDPLRWTVRVLDAKDDRELYAQAYAPRSSLGAFEAAVAPATVLLRSPLANTLVFTGVVRQESHVDRNFHYRSEFLAGGRRPWLWLLDLGVAAACGAACARLLRRRGAPALWTAAWSVFALLFGPVALLVVWLLEPKRRARAVPSAAAVHEPALAIQSA